MMGQSTSQRPQALLLRCLSIALLFIACAIAQTIPHTEAETLSGKKIVLPDDFAGHIAVLNIGFSRAGGDSSGRWGKQLRQDLGGEKNLRLYSIAELQDAPKMARGMIKHGMRGGVPKEEQDLFVVLYQDEDTWKKLADFSAADDAYILLADPTGKVVWRTHGKSPDPQSINALRTELAKLTSH
jgi:hypothetical protein